MAGGAGGADLAGAALMPGHRREDNRHPEEEDGQTHQQVVGGDAVLGMAHAQGVQSAG